MHEHGLMRNVIRMVEEGGAIADDERVVSITLRIGALAAADPEHLRVHFIEAARGTIAEGANLQFVVAADVFDPCAQEVVLEELTVARAAVVRTDECGVNGTHPG